MDVEYTFRYLDIALLEAFSPAIRILAAEVVFQFLPTTLGQVLIHHNGCTAAKRTISLFHRNHNAFHMGGQIGIALRIEVLFQVVALLLDLCKDLRLILDNGTAVKGQHLISAPVFRVMADQFRRQRRIQFESQIIQVISPHVIF